MTPPGVNQRKGDVPPPWPRVLAEANVILEDLSPGHYLRLLLLFGLEVAIAFALGFYLMQ